MSSTELKRKEFSLEIKSVTETGRFSGYASVFDVIDSYKDRVLKGAFLKSLSDHAAKGTFPAMFLNHSFQRECGEWLKMEENDKGLFVEGQLWIDGPNPDPDALKAYRGMKKQKGKMGLSIGYNVPENGSRFDAKSGVTDLIEIDLWETSPVVFPANEAARVENVRSAITTTREFERFLRDAGFSRSEATAISKSFKTATAQGEPDSELLELARNRWKF